MAETRRTSPELDVACLAVGPLATRGDRNRGELRETRTVDLLIRAFEPPGPPENAAVTASGDAADRDDDSPDTD